jgi:3-dehydroquinate synthetase
MNNLTSYESPDFSWEPVIYESLKIKARFVKKDPYDEKDIQKGLSYGHTFANALEGLSEFDFRHGEAVALGMRISGSISYRLGMLSEKDFKLQEKLLDLARLPSKFPGYIHPDEIITYLKKDKISTDGLVSLIILEKIGKHRVIKKVNEDLIMSVLNTFEP